MSGDDRKEEALPPNRAQRKLEAQECAWSLANLFETALQKQVRRMNTEPRQTTVNEMVKMGQLVKELRSWAVGPDPENGEMFEDPAYVARLKKEFAEFFSEEETIEVKTEVAPNGEILQKAVPHPDPLPEGEGCGEAPNAMANEETELSQSLVTSAATSE